MSVIRQRMIEDMQLHGYSAKTQAAYIGAVRGLAKYYHRSPEEITQEEVRAYFLWLVKERATVILVNFFYGQAAFQQCPFRIMALRITNSLRMHAVTATL